MDPNVTLAELRQAVLDWDGATESDDAGDRIDAAEAMASHFADLDQWLSRGGFLPAAWERSR